MIQSNCSRVSSFIQGTSSARTSFSKFAVVIVDMQTKPDTSLMTYRHGSVNDGVRRVCELLDFANRMGIPILIVSSDFLSSKVVPDIVAGAGKNAQFITKRVSNAFFSDHFTKAVASSRADSLVIGGFNRSCCVKETVRGALKNKFTVLTSDEILFGLRCKNRVVEHLVLLPTLLYYRLHTNYYKNLDDLVSAVRFRID